MANEPSLMHWLATSKDQVIGGASVGMHDGIALLQAAATLPCARRRGVQTALLAARLWAARAAGCKLAVVTTEPGTVSHRNAQHAGFSLLYARCIWAAPAQSRGELP